jgi:hypothetical protein
MSRVALGGSATHGNLVMMGRNDCQGPFRLITISHQTLNLKK